MTKITRDELIEAIKGARIEYAMKVAKGEIKLNLTADLIDGFEADAILDLINKEEPQPTEWEKKLYSEFVYSDLPYPRKIKAFIRKTLKEFDEACHVETLECLCDTCKDRITEVRRKFGIEEGKT